MFKLDGRLTLDKEAIEAKNLTDRFSDEDLTALGNHVWEGYDRDNNSRQHWYRRNEAGMDLALQVHRAKSFPWPGCSNVAFPLVTIAAMQFHARAYPSIIQGTDIVKCRINGDDPTGEIQQRANRISNHMSWQCYEQDCAWEEQHDRLLLNVAIVGTAFVKTYYDGAKGYNVSELVLAKDLVVDYYAKSIEAASRKSQIIPLSRNDLYSGAKRGKYRRGLLDETWYSSMAGNDVIDERNDQDKRQGVEPPQSDELTPFQGIEQHVRLDLDKDGYAEPYIITIDRSSRYVIRLVCGFDREEDIERNEQDEIVEIQATEYYTKVTFIPNPDGGFYDVGFGVLLGPLNESVNTAINQLFDAGTMATTAGGFLGRGAKIRGGVYNFSPFGWQHVDTTGDDLRKNMVQLEVREPSPVLFNLLSLLINYVNRISGANDMMVGENPGQNTPAETSRMMLEQGEKIYNAVFKRIWRGMKEEFKKLYVLNAIFLPDRVSYGQVGAKVSRQDYLGDPNLVAPAADPNLSSKGARFNQAQAVKASAMQTPGYDPDQVEQFYLRSLDVSPEVVKQIFPGVAAMPPGKDIKLQIAELNAQMKDKELQAHMALEAARLQLEARKMDAEISKLQAEIQLKMVELEGDVEDRDVQRMNAMVSMMKTQAEKFRSQADIIMTQLEQATRAAEEAREAARFQTEQAEKGLKGAVEIRKLQQKDRELDIKEKVANKPRQAA